MYLLAMGLFDKFQTNLDTEITKTQLLKELDDLKKDMGKLDVIQETDLVALEKEVEALVEGSVDQKKGKDILSRIDIVKNNLESLKGDVDGGSQSIDGSDEKLKEIEAKLSNYSMKIKENPTKVAEMKREIERLEKDIAAREDRLKLEKDLLEGWKKKEDLTNEELKQMFDITRLKLATIESEFERDALKQISNGKYTNGEERRLSRRSAKIDEAKKEFFEITKRDYEQECFRQSTVGGTLTVGAVANAEFRESKIIVTKNPAQYVENLLRNQSLLNAPEYANKSEVQKSILNVIDNHQAGDILIKINAAIGQSLTDERALKEYMKNKGLTDATVAKTRYAITTVMGSEFAVTASQVEQVLQLVNPNVMEWTNGVKELVDETNKQFGSVEQETKKIQTLGLDGWVAEKAAKFTNAGQYAGLLGMGAQAFAAFKALKWFWNASLEEKAMGFGGFIAAFGIMPWDVFTAEGRAKAKNPLAKWGGLKSIDKELKVEEIASYGATPILTALYSLNENNQFDTYQFIGAKDGKFTLDLKGITQYLDEQPIKDTDLAAMESREMFRTLNKLTDGQEMVNSAVTYAMGMMGVDTASFTRAKSDGTIENLFDTEIGLYDATNKSMIGIIETQGKSDYEIKDQVKYDKVVGGNYLVYKDKDGNNKEIHFTEINDPNNTNNQQKEEVLEYLIIEGIIGKKGVMDANGDVNQAYLNQMNGRIERDIFDYSKSKIDAFEPSTRTPEQMKAFQGNLLGGLADLIQENPNEQITYVQRIIGGKSYFCMQNKDVVWPLPLSNYGTNQNSHKIYGAWEQAPIYDDSAESIKEYIQLNYQLLGLVSKFRGQSSYSGSEYFTSDASGIKFNTSNDSMSSYIKSGGPFNAANNLFDTVTLPPKLKGNALYVRAILSALNNLKSEDNQTPIWHYGSKLPQWMKPDVYRDGSEVKIAQSTSVDDIQQAIRGFNIMAEDKLDFDPMQALEVKPDDATIPGSYLLKLVISGNEHSIRIVKSGKGYIVRGPLSLGKSEDDRYNLPPHGETLSLESAAKFAAKVLDFESKNQGLGHPKFKDIFYANDTHGLNMMGYKFGDIDGDRSIRFIKKLSNNALEQQGDKRFYNNSIVFASEKDLQSLVAGSDKQGGNYFVDNKEMVADRLSSMAYDNGHRLEGGSVRYRGDDSVARPTTNPNVSEDSIAKLPGHAISYVYHSFMDPLITLVAKEIPDFMRGGPADLNEYMETKFAGKKPYQWIMENYPGDTPQARYVRQTFVASQICNYSKFKPFFAMVNYMEGKKLSGKIQDPNDDKKMIDATAEIGLNRAEVIQLLTGHGEQLAANYVNTYPNLAGLLRGYDDQGGGSIIANFFISNGRSSGLDMLMDNKLTPEQQEQLKVNKTDDRGSIVMRTFKEYPVSLGLDTTTSRLSIKQFAKDSGSGLLDFISDDVAPAAGVVLEKTVSGFAKGLGGILDTVNVVAATTSNSGLTNQEKLNLINSRSGL